MQEWRPRKRHRRWNRFKNRIYSLNTAEKIALGVLAGIGLAAAVRLGMYISDRNDSLRVNAELREVYSAEISREAERIPTAAPADVTLEEEEQDERQVKEEAMALPTPTVPATLGIIRNALEVNAAISALQERSAYIVGWLTIPDQVDEAVAQLDHDFFLDHDAYGNRNINGAIFLDSLCSLDTRPYTILLYGHNMRTGEKFGKLSRYQDQEYYEQHPFIHFTSLHDDAEYEVFAAGRISVNRNDPNYVNFLSLTSSSSRTRQHEINTLLDCSEIESGVEVRADDQLVVLVTCEGDEDQRWAVCARRVRE